MCVKWDDSGRRPCYAACSAAEAGLRLCGCARGNGGFARVHLRRAFDVITRKPEDGPATTDYEALLTAMADNCDYSINNQWA